MKKKLVIVGALLLILILAVAGTVANSVAEVHTTNVITTGVIDIELVPDEERTVNYPNCMPGRTVETPIAVAVNKSSGPAWLRAKLTFGFSDEKLDPSKMEVKIAKGWFDGGDGFYYYEAAANPAQEPIDLIEGVTFKGDMGNEYQGSEASLTVYAQAVQVKNQPKVAEDAKITAQTCGDIQGWSEMPAKKDAEQ